MDSLPSGSNEEQQEQQKQQQQDRGYQRTESRATTSGQDYEVALCCLFFLRALRFCGGDFFLASNYKDAGKFDDVVLFYRLKGDPDPGHDGLLLQAKHKDNAEGKTLSPKQLDEYFRSFAEVKELLLRRPLVVDGRRISLRGLTLVHYTNAGCVVDKHASDAAADLPGLRDLLDTGGRLLRIPAARKVGLPEGDDASEFLGKFLMCTQQMSVRTADEILREELRNVLGLQSVDDNVTAKYTSELKNWWSGGGGRGSYLTADSDEWNSVLLMRHNCDTLAAKAEMNLGFGGPAELLDDGAATWIRVADGHQARVTRVRLLAAREKCLVLGAEYLEDHWAEVEDLWGKGACTTLALDVTGCPQSKFWVNQCLKMVAKTGAPRRQLVVVAAEEPTTSAAAWNVVAPPATWSVLDDETRERLLTAAFPFLGLLSPGGGSFPVLSSLDGG